MDVFTEFHSQESTLSEHGYEDSTEKPILFKDSGSKKQAMDVAVELLSNELPDLKDLMVELKLTASQFSHVFKKNSEMAGAQIDAFLKNKDNLSAMLSSDYDTQNLLNLMPHLGPDYDADIQAVASEFNAMSKKTIRELSGTEVNKILVKELYTERSTRVPKKTKPIDQRPEYKLIVDKTTNMNALMDQIQAFIFKTGLTSKQLIRILSGAGNQSFDTLNQLMQKEQFFLQLQPDFMGLKNLADILSNTGQHVNILMEALPKYKDLMHSMHAQNYSVSRIISAIRKQLILNDYPPTYSTQMDALRNIGFTVEGIYSVATGKISYYDKVIDLFSEYKANIMHFMQQTGLNASNLTSILNTSGLRTKIHLRTLLASQHLIIKLRNIGIDPANIASILHNSRSKLKDNINLLVNNQDLLLNLKYRGVKVSEILSTIKHQLEAEQGYIQEKKTGTLKSKTSAKKTTFAKSEMIQSISQMGDQNTVTSLTESLINDQKPAAPQILSYIKTVQPETIESLSNVPPSTLTMSQIESICDPLSEHLPTAATFLNNDANTEVVAEKPLAVSSTKINSKPDEQTLKTSINPAKEGINDNEEALLSQIIEDLEDGMLEHYFSFNA